MATADIVKLRNLANLVEDGEISIDDAMADILEIQKNINRRFSKYANDNTRDISRSISLGMYSTALEGYIVGFKDGGLEKKKQKKALADYLRDIADAIHVSESCYEEEQKRLKEERMLEGIVGPEAVDDPQN